MISRVPLGFDQLVAAFGDPRPFVREDGSVAPQWEKKILAVARLPAPLPLSWDRGRMVATFRCHRRLVPAFERALSRVHDDPAAWASIGDFGGCYAFRANRRNPRRLSAHAWGAAIDLDVADNQQGVEPHMHPAVVLAFEEVGFVWGGRFLGLSRDGMHFEFGDLGALGGS